MTDALPIAAAVLALGARPSDDARAVTGYHQGPPFDLVVKKIDGAGHELALEPALAFSQMRSAAAAAGVYLQVNSGFRSYEEQLALWELWQAGKGNRAAAPGWSNHQAGRALDIESEAGTNAAFRWLVDTGMRHGFVRTVPDEPWHWEYAR